MLEVGHTELVRNTQFLPCPENAEVHSSALCCLGFNLCFQLEALLQCGRGVSGDKKGDTGQRAGSLCLLYALFSQGC